MKSVIHYRRLLSFGENFVKLTYFTDVFNAWIKTKQLTVPSWCKIYIALRVMFTALLLTLLYIFLIKNEDIPQFHCIYNHKHTTMTDINKACLEVVLLGNVEAVNLDLDLIACLIVLLSCGCCTGVVQQSLSNLYLLVLVSFP